MRPVADVLSGCQDPAGSSAIRRRQQCPHRFPGGPHSIRNLRSGEHDIKVPDDLVESEVVAGYKVANRIDGIRAHRITVVPTQRCYVENLAVNADDRVWTAVKRAHIRP